MGGTSQTMNMPPGNATIPGTNRETELSDRMSSTATARRPFVHAGPYYCEFCRSIVGAAHLRHTSPLAAIDVYGLPDDTEILSAPEHSN